MNVTLMRPALLAAMCILVFSRCGGGGGDKVAGPVGVVSVMLTPPSATVRVGVTMQLSATATINGTPATGETITFSSDNAPVVSVTPQGFLRALSVGTATITARAASGPSMSAVITVIPGLPYTIAKVGGDNQSSNIATAVPIAPSAVVRDSVGNLLAGVAVTFAVASGGGTVSGGSATTDATGVAAAASWTLGTVGANTLTATTPGLPAVTFTATATQPSIALATNSVSVVATGASVTPVTQTVAVANGATGTLSGVSLGTITYGSGTGWLSAMLSGNSAPATITLTASAAALSGGVYSATVPVIAAGAANSPASLTVTFTVAAAPATQVSIVAQPGGATSGTALTAQPVVQIRDALNGVVAGAANAVTATLVGAGGVLAGATTVNAVSGVATFTGLTVTGAGTYSIVLSAVGLAPTTSASFTVALAPAVKLAMLTQPAGAPSGSVLATQPVLEIRNAQNGVVAGATNAVTATLVGAGGVLSGTTTVGAINGIATFTNLKVTGPGAYTLNFTSAGLTATASSAFAVAALPEYDMAVVTQPSGAVSGSAFVTQPVIAIRDKNGNIVAGSAIAVTATLNSGNGVLTGTTTVNAVGGMATFADLAVTGVGNNSITFTAPGLALQVSAPFTVVPAPPSQLAVATQPAGGTSGSTLATQPVVQVRYASNGVAAGATNAVTAALVGVGGTLSGTATVSAVNGVATFTNLAVTGAGTFAISFSSPGLSAATSSSFTVAPAPPTQLAVLTQPAGATSGSVLTTQPVVQILDGNGGVAAGATNAVTAALVGAGGTLSGTTTVSAVAGVVTFTSLAVTGVGTYTIRFTSTGLSAATSSSVTVVAAPPSQLAVVTQPTGATSGFLMATQPVVQVRDAGNGVVVGATSAVTATLVGVGGTLAGATTVNAVNGAAAFTDLSVTGPGTYTLTFSAPGLTPATSGSLSIASPQAPGITVAIGSAPSAIAASGTNLVVPIVVDMTYAQGQVLAALTFSVTWDPAKFDFVSTTNGSFGTSPSFSVNQGGAAAGTLTVSVFDTDGFASGTPTVFTVTLLPKVASTNNTVTTLVTVAGDALGNAIPLGLFTVRPLVVIVP